MKWLRRARKIHVLWYYTLHTAASYRTIRAMKKYTRPEGEQLNRMGASVGAAYSALYADPWKDQT